MTQPTTETITNGTTNHAAAAIVPARPDAGEPSRTLSAFSDVSSFNAAQRMAKALSCSSLMPAAYQGDQGIPNILICMELANRIGASVFMVAQNLDVIHGRPSWRAQFLIATVNACGRFTPLRFRFSGKEGTDEWGCRAYAKDRESGEECVGPLITIRMAKDEGWATKNGSKWRTMPELMMSYRSAAFWTRIFAPELSLGIQTREEVIDTTGFEVPDAGPGPAAGDTKALAASLLAEPAKVAPPAKPPEPVVETKPAAPAAATHDADGVVADPPAGEALAGWLTDPSRAVPPVAKPVVKDVKDTPPVKRMRESGED